MTQRPDTQSIWLQMNEALRRYIRRRVSDDYTADDLVQETFLRIERNIGGLRSVDHVTAWVYRIARSIVQDHYRRRREVPLELLQDVADLPQASGADPLCGDHPRWMDELIAQLPEKYRLAVRLAEIEGLPLAKVANQLGTSLSGAKSRLQRGRALLKNALERCCIFSLDARGNVYDFAPKPHRTVCRSSCEQVRAPAPGGAGRE